MNPLERLEKILTEICTVIDDLAKAEQPAPAPKQDNSKKLSPRDVKVIRDMKRSGKSVTDIAIIFDVHHATISRIVRGIYHRGVR